MAPRPKTQGPTTAKHMTAIYNKIIALLDEHGVEYTTEHHEPTLTSEDAARVRGTSMKSGAKALVMQGKKTKTNWVFVLPADLRLDTKKIQQIVGERVSFCPNLEEATGCPPGSMPPFGSIVGLKTYFDPKLSENEEINFNAGSLTDSVNMKFSDYIAIEQPEVVEVTE